ncbi:MAG: hypothetical protein ACP5FZ_02160 [Fidelibacterota bacterium]
MIRLNLTNQPGLQVVDQAEEFDLEGLILEESVEETGIGGETPESAQKAREKDIAVPDLDNIPDMPLEPSLSDENDIPEIDEDLFKMAEANLDLIEQAEEEEAGSKAKVKKVPETSEKTGKKPKKFPLFRYGIIVGGLLVLIILFWLYSNGKLTRDQVSEVTREVTESVSERASQTVDNIPDATRQLRTDVGEATKKITAELSTSREQLSSRLSRSSAGGTSYGPSDLSENVIQMVQRGQFKLNLVADVLAQMPGDARILYLRIKDDKLSFIVYVRSEQAAEQLQGYFTDHSRFFPPEVFFIERSAKNSDNPVEVTAIIRFRMVGSDDQRGYHYLTDRQLSQYSWQAALISDIQMSPLKISGRDIYSVRNAEITGTGKISSIIDLLRELAVQRHNMAVDILSLKSDTAVFINEGLLAYNLSSVIYPGNR